MLALISNSKYNLFKSSDFEYAPTFVWRFCYLYCK